MIDTGNTKTRKDDGHRYQTIQRQERMINADNTKTRKDDRHR